MKGQCHTATKEEMRSRRARGEGGAECRTCSLCTLTLSAEIPFNCTILYGYNNIYYLPVDWFGKSQHISLGSVEFHRPLIATCRIMHKRSRYLEPTAKRI